MSQFFKKRFSWSEWNVVAELQVMSLQLWPPPILFPGGRGGRQPRGRGAVSRQFQLSVKFISSFISPCDSVIPSLGHSWEMWWKTAVWQTEAQLGARLYWWDRGIHRPWDPAWLSQGSYSTGASGLWSIWHLEGHVLPSWRDASRAGWHPSGPGEGLPVPAGGWTRRCWFSVLFTTQMRLKKISRVTNSTSE